MIWTSSFYNLNNFPDCIVPIAICGKSPDWYVGAEYKKLAPTWSIYSEWKKVYDEKYRCKKHPRKSEFI